MVDGFSMTFPLLLQLIFAVLALLSALAISGRGFAEEVAAEQWLWSVWPGAFLSGEAPPGSRFARAAAPRFDARGYPLDAIRPSGRFSSRFDRRT